MGRRIRWRNNSGSTLVIVVIAMAFVGVLATMVLSMSVTSIQMKAIDRSSKENFYNAETVLDEIEAGIEQDLGTYLQSAYEQTMKVYSMLPVGDRNFEFQKLFMNSYLKAYDTAIAATDYIVNNSSKSDSIHYNPEKLKGYLQKTVSQATVSSDSATQGTLEYSFDGMNADKRYIIFKNVIITYTGSDKAYTSLKTDIKVQVPQVDFESIGNIPPFTEYALIANTKLYTEESNINIDTNVNGNVYAGEKGLVVNGASATLDGTKTTLKINANRLITRGNVTATDGGVLSVFNAENNTEVWAQNIETVVTNDKDASSKMNLTGQFYIADDVTLDAPNSTIKLAGDYNGYGYEDQAKGSSSLIVNRSNSVLDLSGINNLFIAGRAFIKPDQEVPGSENVLTGEAITVKANHRIYLLPGACIKEVNQNPVSIEDYNAHHTSNWDEVDVNVEVVPGKKLSYYVNSAKPVCTIFDVSAAGYTVVNYYPNFKSFKEANEYYQDCISANGGNVSEEMKASLKDYYSSVIKPVNTGGRNTCAGNMFYYDRANQNSADLEHNSVDEFLPNRYKEESDAYANEYKNLYTKLVQSGCTATELSYPDIFKTLIADSSINPDESKVVEVLNGDPKKVFTDAAYGDYILVNNPTSTYVVDSSVSESVHLIIATGDVEVTKDFTGLIISKGQITLSDGVTVTADAEKVFGLLCHTDAGKIFRDYVNFGIYLKGAADKTVTLRDLITEENWSKN